MRIFRKLINRLRNPLILNCRKPDKPLLIHIKPQRVHRRDPHIDPQVKLVTIDQVRVIHIMGHHVALPVPGDLGRGVDEEDALTLGRG